MLPQHRQRRNDVCSLGKWMQEAAEAAVRDHLNSGKLALGIK